MVFSVDWGWAINVVAIPIAFHWLSTSVAVLAAHGWAVLYFIVKVTALPLVYSRVDPEYLNPGTEPRRAFAFVTLYV
jgi:hypothetical protein